MRNIKFGCDVGTRENGNFSSVCLSGGKFVCENKSIPMMSEKNIICTANVMTGGPQSSPMIAFDVLVSTTDYVMFRACVSTRYSHFHRFPVYMKISVEHSFVGI